MLDKVIESLKSGNSFQVFSGIALLSFLILLLPVPIDNIKFIITALLVLGGLSFLMSQDIRIFIPNNKFIFGIGGFLVFTFISTFWASDTTMAIRESFTWLLFFLLTILVAAVAKNNNRFEYSISKMFAIFFIAFLVFHLGAIQFDIGFGPTWNALMSKNKNYTTSFLTTLSPYLIFYPSKSQFVRFIKIVSIVLLANLLFLSGSRGALLAFSFILLLKYWNFYAESKYRYLGVLLLGGLIVGGIYFLNTSKASSEFLFVEDYRKELAARVHMNKNSIASFRESPIVGVGSGQWYNDIYRHGTEDVLPFSDPSEFIRYRSHNLYFKILVEYGIIGFALFFGILYGILWKHRSRWTELTGYSKAAWACIMSYLVIILFYADAISYEYFFSSITLVAFVSLGLLFALNDKQTSVKRTLAVIPISLSFLVLCWFLFSKYNYEGFKKVQLAAEKGDEQLLNAALLDTYNSSLNSTYNYSISISQLLAENYSRLEDIENANYYYNIALNERPNSEPLLRSYVAFCIKHNMNNDRARGFTQKLIDIHPNFVENKILQSKI